ncbi:MAG: TlpA disulfide reductase family protein, partial [Bacteroidota bacterium]
MKTFFFLLALLLSLPLYGQNPHHLLEAAEAKYVAISSGHVKYHQKNYTEVNMDTSYTTHELYFHRQADLQPIAARLNYVKQGLISESQTYHTVYLWSESDFLSAHYQEGTYYELDRADEIYTDNLNGNFWMVPFPSTRKSRSYFRGLRKESLILRAETAEHWVLAVDETFTVWLTKGDTLLTKVVHTGVSQGIAYYNQMDMIWQEFDQPQFEEANLYARSFFPDTLVAMVIEEVSAEGDPLSVGSSAPNWRLRTLEGDSLALSDLRGKVVVLDFWYVGCLPCYKAMPYLQEIAEEYHSKGVMVIGINPMGQDSDRQAEYLQEKGIMYPTVHADPEEGWGKVYGVKSYPSLFIIDPDGKVAYREVGF